VGHIVVFEGSDQVPTYHRCEELADAVSLAEKLRNDRGVERVQILRTEAIRFDFKPYYRVELGDPGVPSAPAAAVEVTPVAAAPVPAPVMAPIAPPPPPPPTDEAGAPSELAPFDTGDDLSVASGARRGLFGR
jgi:hypothetical protein